MWNDPSSMATPYSQAVSSVTESYLGWRWVFWVIMICAAICTILTILIFPETYEPVILQQKVCCSHPRLAERCLLSVSPNKARHLRRMDPATNQAKYSEHEKHDWSMKGILHRTIYRPFFLLGNEPILVLITMFLSLEYGVLYGREHISLQAIRPLRPFYTFLVFEAFPIIFEKKRGFSVSNDGLVFVGVAIGASIGALLSVYLDGSTPDMIRKWHNSPPPEMRLYGAMFGGPCLVLGIFWLGWTGEYSAVPWYVPAMSTLPIGASITLVFISFTVSVNRLL